MTSNRRTTEGIAQRIRKNMEFVCSTRDHAEADVHMVTQVVNSLFGLVILPPSMGN